MSVAFPIGTEYSYVGILVLHQYVTFHSKFSEDCPQPSVELHPNFSGSAVESHLKFAGFALTIFRPHP
jgi:hypothetical protein